MCQKCAKTGSLSVPKVCQNRNQKGCQKCVKTGAKKKRKTIRKFDPVVVSQMSGRFREGSTGAHHACGASDVRRLHSLTSGEVMVVQGDDEPYLLPARWHEKLRLDVVSSDVVD